MRLVSGLGGTIVPEVLYDYKRAASFGRLKLGYSGAFIPKGTKMIHRPYDHLSRVYVEVHDARARMCCASMNYAYYRLVFLYGDRVVGDYLSEDRDAMKAALAFLRENAPYLEIGAE